MKPLFNLPNPFYFSPSSLMAPISITNSNKDKRQKDIKKNITFNAQSSPAMFVSRENNPVD